VNENVVDRGADGSGETPVAFGGRNPAAIPDHFFADVAEVLGRDPGLNQGSDDLIDMSEQFSGFAHEVNLTRAFDDDH
jgi:hypothetical protein